MFQFDKERRDSSINDHHLHHLGFYNRGYGLLFDSDGSAAVVKTEEFGKKDELLKLTGEFDYSVPVHVCITQQRRGDELVISVELGDSGVVETVSDKLTEGFDDSGYIGLTVFFGRSSVALKNISVEGRQYRTDLGQKPRALYLADYFECEGRRLVHWRYDEWTTDYQKVLIKSPDGQILDILPYPQDTWTVPSGYDRSAVVLCVTNVDGRVSEPVQVRLQDDHADYFAEGGMERVLLRKTERGGRFYLKDSGHDFVVKGVNYVRLRYGDHCTFEADTANGPSCYDPYDAESMFKLLKKYGYNTVRVFVVGRNLDNPGVSGDYDNEGLYGPYMANFIDFVERARKYGIYVFPTFCDGELPRNKRYWDIIKDAREGLRLDDVTHRTHNAVYATVEGHRARALYLQDFLNYLKAKDASLLTSLLAVQCQNELSMKGTQWPFDITEGEFKGPDGKAYNMGRDDERQKLYENIFACYHQAMVEAIDAVDSEILVGEGIFVPRIVGKDYDGANYGIRNLDESSDRCPPKASLLLGSELDFVDIHIYYVDKECDLAESYKRDMVSTGLYSDAMKEILQSKAFFMGEFGSFKFMAESFGQAKCDILATRDLALNDGAHGFMIWTFDTFEQRGLWHAMEDEKFLKELNDTIK